MRVKQDAIVAIIICVISLIITITYFVLLSKSHLTIGYPVDIEKTAQIGDYIGGMVGTIISGAAFWFLYLTLREQRNSLQKQKIEAHFFEMLKIYEKNISNMKYDASHLIIDKGSFYIAQRLYEKNDVFQIFFQQFITCRNELMPIFHKHRNLYNQQYEQMLKENQYIKDTGIDIYKLGYIDICYCILFYGTNSEGLMTLRSLFKNKYKDPLIDKVLKFISLKPAYNKIINKRWKEISTISKRRELLSYVEDVYNWRVNQTHKNFNALYPDISIGYSSDFEKYYSGYHQMLGHHYRHLFQMVKYINEQKELSYEEKYNYIKFMRSQMSNYEQIVFFLNSISIMGRNWEIMPEINVKLKDYHKYDFQLITKYKLIKNIPNEILFGIKYKTYYPYIEYEFGENSSIEYSYK